MLYLVRHPGRLVTRDELIAAVWGETIVEEGNLHWTISAVRKALAQESGETWIETVRGLGYRFLGTVETVGEDAVPETRRRRLRSPRLPGAVPGGLAGRRPRRRPARGGGELEDRRPVRRPAVTNPIMPRRPSGSMPRGWNGSGTGMR